MTFNIHVAKCLQASSLLCSWSAIPNSEILSQVSRLDAAIAEEDAKTSQPDKGKLTSTSKPKNEDTENGKEGKRKRTAGPIVDGDGAKPTKRLKVEEISKMSVADLKAALTDRGLESTGVKRELVKRLTQALEAEDNVNKKDDDDDAQDAGEIQSLKKTK